MSVLISQLCVMIISCNLPCTSGWRPSFKYYSQWVALLGSGVCLVIMFVISWWAALITLVAVGALYKIVDWTKPGKNRDRERAKFFRAQPRLCPLTSTLCTNF